jgi:DMSO/TMAO reductase YedYZ heme-binding membrane subunit
LINKKSLIISSSIITSFLLFIYFIYYGDNNENAKSWTRYSAHLSFYYFFLSFAASSFNSYFRYSVTKTILSHRRYFGISFTIAHSFHLIALTYFFTVSVESPALVSIIGGGAGYLIMYAMAFTSNDRMVKRIGERKWKILHKIGSSYLVVIFIYAFIFGFIFSEYRILYGFYILLIFSVYSIKFLNKAKKYNKKVR